MDPLTLLVFLGAFAPLAALASGIASLAYDDQVGHRNSAQWTIRRVGFQAAALFDHFAGAPWFALTQSRCLISRKGRRHFLSPNSLGEEIRPVANVSRTWPRGVAENRLRGALRATSGIGFPVARMAA